MAGPRALAGLMQFELMGPVIHMLKVMPRAIAKGPNWPQPLHIAAHQCFVDVSVTLCNTATTLPVSPSGNTDPIRAMCRQAVSSKTGQQTMKDLPNDNDRHQLTSCS